jgi:hypothetical protein
LASDMTLSSFGRDVTISVSIPIRDIPMAKRPVTKRRIKTNRGRLI